MKLTDGYELTQILTACSVTDEATANESTPVTRSFAISVYTHPSGTILYIRADPDAPIDHWLIGSDLDDLLPADVVLGEPYDEDFVKAVAQVKRVSRD